MDALSHAIEAVQSASYNPLSTAMALEAIRRIVKYLPVVVENGKDIAARHQMLVGTLTDLSMYGNPRPTSDPTPVVQMVKDSL